MIWPFKLLARTNRLEITFNKADYVRFTLEAKRRGRNLRDFVLDLLKANTLPTIKQLQKISSSEEAREEAYKLLDHEEEVGFVSLPPAPVREPQLSAAAQRELAKAGHPCRFLDTSASHNGSIGLCRNPKQDGRPCYWSAGVARKCPVFGPKNVTEGRTR